MVVAAAAIAADQVDEPARAKRRAAIARLAGRIEKQQAAAERAAATDHDDEDLETRLDRVPEVDVDA